MTLIYILPLYVLAWACARLCLKDPVLRAKSESPAQYWQLDGLRFFLAFSVFLHHAFIIRHYVGTGVWALTGDRVVTFLGQGGVSLFFIITAFLFWDKALRKPLQFDAVEFLSSRIRRLAPAYLIVAIPFLILSLTQFPFLDWGFLGDFLRILSLGYFGAIDIGHLRLSPAYIGAFWTLFYEWKFYFFLPMIYLLLRNRRGWNLTATLCILILLLSVFSDTGISRDWPYISLFAAGILAATFYNSKYFAELKINQFSVQIVFLSSILLNLFTSEIYYGGVKPILFLISFLSLLKLEKSTFLGKILCNPATILLGAASYSIYVAHGFIISILAILLHLIVGDFSDIVFVIFCLISTSLVAILSLVIYKHIELPFAFKKSGKP